MKKIMFLLLLIIFSFMGVGFKCIAENKWENPAERYLDVHKKYLGAKCPVPKSNIKHFVYFARDREKIKNHPFLKHSGFSGAQIMYSWKELEPEKGIYDFSAIREDYQYLRSYDKKLFIQIQDATFYPKYKAVPNYLLTDEYDGGLIEQMEDNRAEGWTAKRWNKNVRKRFARLLRALGREFDGKIEGINLQESAIGVSHDQDSSFTPEKYVDGLKANMRAMKKAFPNSTTMQYANFMPGEWLPWDDKGYLRSIYMYGEKIGVGLGGPDLIYNKKAQLNHTIAMMHENKFTVPLGIAIQDGNYISETGSDRVISNHKNIVPVLYCFAAEFMKVDYIFWSNQEPYFKTDVLGCIQK